MNILNKYKKMSPLLKASVWFTVCSFLQKGIQFMVIPVFTRLLSTEEYGIYNIYNSWLQIIIIFATLNLFYGVFNVGMVKFQNDREGYISSLQGVSTSSTVLCFIVYICFANLWNKVFELPTFLMIIMFIQILFFPQIQYWSAKQKFDYKYKLLIFVTLLISVLDPLLGVLAVKTFADKVTARVLSSIIVQSAIGIILYIIIQLKGGKFFNKKYWKFILKFSMPLIPHYLSSTILNSSDRIIISQLCGTSKAAIYSVAYSASIVLLILNSAINNSFVPWTYENMKKNNYKNISSLSNIILIIIGGMNILLIAFAPEIIKVMVPKDYHEAIWIIPPVTGSVFFLFVYNLLANIEFYFEENKFIAFASVIGAVLNIALNYLFIPIFGYMSAGYITLFCYIVYCFAHYIFMKSTVKKHLKNVDIYNFRDIFLISLSFIFICALLMLFYDFWIIRYLFILVILLVAYKKSKIIFPSLKQFIFIK